MRCWHYKLLPYLPKSQLLGQWRELNSIFKKQDKHILINYVYEYGKYDMGCYVNLVYQEMLKRGYKFSAQSIDNVRRYFKDEPAFLYTKDYKPFKNHHTKQYLLQCFMNLEEKYFCGQKDFDTETYLKLWNFVNEELNGLLQEINKELKEE